MGLSDLWLGAQAVGVVRAALDDVAGGIKTRRAIIGVPMVDLPMVAMRLGEASSLIATADAAITVGCSEIDTRIAKAAFPARTTISVS